MKKLVNKTKGLVRGTSTAVLLSVAIHAVLFFGAGVWVVFKFIDAKEAKFVPQKIDRPKMKLKKLRVKVKEQAKPRKTTQRIASSRKSADLPDIQLPEMTGMGAGLEGAIGGFDMMADLSKMTLMGGGKSVGNDLEGTFYDFSRDRSGNSSGLMPQMHGSSAYLEIVGSFLEDDWSPNAFSEFYRSPSKLYATQFLIPPTASVVGPLQFGIDPDEIKTGGALWVAHYKGKIAHKTGGTFRFRAFAEDMGYIRIGGELVWKCSAQERFDRLDPERWKSSSDENRMYGLGNGMARVGDWFTLEAGVPLEMELLTGEDIGGWYCCMILIEQQGVEYPENSEGGPVLPLFRTMETPEHLKDEIKYGTVEGDFTLEGGPIFSLY